MKKNLPFMLFSLLVLGFLNYAIYEKEVLKENGELVYLELAPVDPRSLMQGDYMQLRYKISGQAPSRLNTKWPNLGYVVIGIDRNNVGQTLALHEGTNLAENQRQFRYTINQTFELFTSRRTQFNIVPDTYFFQEGQANIYRNARYGVFIFGESGDYLLIGLADENLIIISPPIE